MSLGCGCNLPPPERRAYCWPGAGPWGPLGHLSAVIGVFWDLRCTQDGRLAKGALSARELFLEDGGERLGAPSGAGAPSRLAAAS